MEKDIKNKQIYGQWENTSDISICLTLLVATDFDFEWRNMYWKKIIFGGTSANPYVEQRHAVYNYSQRWINVTAK